MEALVVEHGGDLKGEGPKSWEALPQRRERLSCWAALLRHPSEAHAVAGRSCSELRSMLLQLFEGWHPHLQRALTCALFCCCLLADEITICLARALMSKC